MSERDYERLRRERPELFRDGGEGAFALLLDPPSVAAAEAAEAARLTNGGLPGERARTGVVYEDEYLMLVRDAVRFPSGRLGTYMRIVPTEVTPGVAVLPLLGDDVVLLKHFRHATRTWHWEIPRGFGSAGKDGAANARKELAEELGTDATDLTFLGPFHPNTGVSSETVELFLARIDRIGALERDEGITQVRTLSTAAVRELVATDELTDSFTIVAYLRAHLRGLLD
jgi:ADP-ribose pyrophosphatase